jgi:hypothetical protein
MFFLPVLVGRLSFFDRKEGAESRMLQIGHYGTQITNSLNYYNRKESRH